MPSVVGWICQDTRAKWLNGGYKYPICIVPDLIGSGDGSELVPPAIDHTSSSPPCQFTSMCTTFDTPLPESVQAKIMSKAGRNKIVPFATRLLNRLYTKQGKEYLGRPTLLALLETKSPWQLGKYLTILENAGVIRRGVSYKAGRNGKLITLDQSVMAEFDTKRP